MVVLVTAVLLVLLPLLWLATVRGGWWETRSRRLLWLAVLGVLALAAPWTPWTSGDGAPFELLKRGKLLILIAVLSVFAARLAGLDWARERGRRLEVWTVLALVSVPVYFNFFDFHGARTFVHLHDVGHYYLGAKYYPELGYGDLYTAVLRAEAETHDNRFRSVEARDLATYDRVHIRKLLQRSEAVRERFSPERWHQFKRDADRLRERLGPHYGTFLLDHGFNPTPAWVLLGHPLANLVPAGSDAGLLAITLLDPLLLLVAFVALGRAFGLEAALLALIHFCVVFGGGFGWVGGGFLRYGWFAAVALGAGCLHRRRHASAGALFAVATMLRVFPGLLVLPLAVKAVAVTLRRGRPAARHVRFFAAGGAVVALSFGATGLLPQGFAHWQDFDGNLRLHMKIISPNVVGLTEALAFRTDGGEVTNEEFNALKDRRQRIRDLQLLALALPLFVLVWRRASRRTDLGAIGLGVLLLYPLLSLAAYYWAVLFVLVVVHRASPHRLTLIFAAEAVPYLLLLFEPREATVHVVRGLALLVLFGMLLYLERASVRLRQLPA